MARVPEDVVNQALDHAGVDFTVGNLQEGTREAQVCLRSYTDCRRQLLRAVHWDFARHQTDLQLVATAVTNPTPAIGVGTNVIYPWLYEYAYPNDCMKFRFIPANPYGLWAPIPTNNIQLPTTPLTTNDGPPPLVGQRLVPTRYLISFDPNYPADPDSEWMQVQGVSPTGRTVVLSNVQNAVGVYTMDMPYPTVWDPLFLAAMVDYLASEIALPLAKDKNMGMKLQARAIEGCRGKVQQARIANGNESGWNSSDIYPDWLRFRNSGGPYGWGWAGPYSTAGLGWCWGGYDTLAFANGSTY